MPAERSNHAPRLRWCGAVSAAVLAISLAGLAQQLPLGEFRNFRLPSYHEAPYERQLKSLLQGEEAIPQGDTKVLVRQLRLETYRRDGSGEFIVAATDCLYDTEDRSAASPGPLAISTADGTFRTEGLGFIWQGAKSTLIISNNVHTIILGNTTQSSTP